MWSFLLGFVLASVIAVGAYFGYAAWDVTTAGHVDDLSTEIESFEEADPMSAGENR